MEATDKRNLELANDSFFANNFVIFIGGRDVFIDFQRIAPRFEMADQEHSYYVDEHNTIILNVATFKDLLAIGANLIKELEVKFGDITTPEFVKKLNEAQQQALTELERRSRDSHNDRPHYMG